DRPRRLKAEYLEFLKLPKERRQLLRDIDEALDDEPPSTQARLWAVLDRYTSWLDRLDPKDRQQIDSAPTPQKKLEAVKAVREREWMSRLAKAQREQIERVQNGERAALIDRFRQKERKDRADWQLAVRLQNDPIQRSPADFRPELQLYVEKSLMPT